MSINALTRHSKAATWVSEIDDFGEEDCMDHREEHLQQWPCP
jgi:hypothetical protein